MCAGRKTRSTPAGGGGGGGWGCDRGKARGGARPDDTARVWAGNSPLSGRDATPPAGLVACLVFVKDHSQDCLRGWSGTRTWPAKHSAFFSCTCCSVQNSVHTRSTERVRSKRRERRQLRPRDEPFRPRCCPVGRLCPPGRRPRQLPGRTVTKWRAWLARPPARTERKCRRDGDDRRPIRGRSWGLPPESTANNGDPSGEYAY